MLHWLEKQICIRIHTIIQKFGIDLDIVFEVSYAYQGYIYLISNTAKQ